MAHKTNNKQYKHILLALELIPENDQRILEKVKTLAELHGADVTLIHSVEHLANYGLAYSVAAVDIEDELRKEAKKSLVKAGETLSVPVERQIVKVGAAKHVILEYAEDKHIDLIVVGSHGRHGVRLLLGSTANAVLHGAKCDVLAVRVND